jgi:hypothetical protein
MRALLALLVSCSASCVVTADESLWRRCSEGRCDAALQPDTRKVDRAGDTPATDAGLPDRAADRTPDRAIDRRPGDGPQPDRRPDLGLPDGQLATYVRTWVTATVPTNPGRLYGPKLTYDSVAGEIVLYGGDDGSAPVAQMWTYNGTGWTQRCNPCAPGPRLFHGLVFDESRGVLVLFGGTDGTSALGDLWEYSGGTWKQIVFTGGPTARELVFMAYDRTRKRTVIFGGIDVNGTLSNAVYEYDGKAWYGPLAPTGAPGPRQNSGSGATFADWRALVPAMRDRVVIFGGGSTTGDDAPVDECWAWDGASWTSICTSCTKTPRMAAALVYDPITGRAVSINGWGGDGVWEIAGTIEHFGANWLGSSQLPGDRDTPGAAFDVKRNRIVSYGGNGGSCGGNCNETLEFIAP